MAEKEPMEEENQDNRSRWDRKHRMQQLAALSHKPEAEAHRSHTVYEQARELSALEDQRGRLRDSSCLIGMQVHYHPETKQGAHGRLEADNRVSTSDPILDQSRLQALRRRLAEAEPPKLSPIDWRSYKDRSIKVLHGYYPNSNLQAIYEWICLHAHEKGRPRLSAAKILQHVCVLYPHTEISTPLEMRDVMKVMAIRWSNLHSSYYVAISKRFDVVAHLREFLPYARMCHEDSRVYFAVADASFLYENSFSNEAWCSRAEPDGDLIDAKPGKGRRYNMMEFLDKEGLLTHPDGHSAGTFFGTSQTQDSREFLRGLERGCEAIAAKATASGGKVAVLLIDGARTQKTMPGDAISPGDMNLSDGGKNRKPMRLIGMKGLQTVLTENRKWPDDGLSLPNARRLMFQWSTFLAQLTEAEEVCRRHNIILLYNPKAHPWMNPIEKIWRLSKYRTQDLLDLDLIKAEYMRLQGEFMSGNPDARRKCQKWFDLSLKYVHFYARGQTEFVRESKMKSLDLARYGSLQVAPSRVGNMVELQGSIHAANNILMLGKKYPVDFHRW